MRPSQPSVPGLKRAYIAIHRLLLAPPQSLIIFRAETATIMTQGCCCHYSDQSKRPCSILPRPSSFALGPSPRSRDELLLSFRLRNGAASLVLIDFWDFAWSVYLQLVGTHSRSPHPQSECQGCTYTVMALAPTQTRPSRPRKRISCILLSRPFEQYYPSPISRKVMRRRFDRFTKRKLGFDRRGR